MHYYNQIVTEVCLLQPSVRYNGFSLYIDRLPILTTLFKVFNEKNEYSNSINQCKILLKIRNLAEQFPKKIEVKKQSCFIRSYYLVSHFFYSSASATVLEAISRVPLEQKNLKKRNEAN